MSLSTLCRPTTKEPMSTSTETKNENPAFDSITNECLRRPVVEWHPNVMAVFADRIEDAFYDKLKGPMMEVHDQLEALLDHVMAGAPEEVRRGILHSKGDDPFRTAYMLGCLSFAQQFAASVAHRRPDNEFYEEFKDDLTKKILVHLVQGDRTKAELSSAAGLALATLNPQMKKLTGLGIVDFRTRFGNGEPGVAEYFLTPAAQQVMRQQAPG